MKIKEIDETLRGKYFVAEEDVEVYNVFAFDDFDEDGYYEGHAQEDGYHISDFDIVYITRNFLRACTWVEEH